MSKEVNISDRLPRLSVTASPSASRNGGRVSMAKAWLEENYSIKVNLLDPSMVFLEAKEANPIKYDFPVSESDIYLHAQEDDIPMSMNMLRQLLQSPNQIDSFNPIIDYFENLKGKYNGPSQIDLLARSLKVSGGDDGGRAAKLLRKWLTATVACALGYRQNDVALGLVYQCVLKGDTSFLPTRGFATRLLLNFDEMAAVTAANEDQFKQLLSSRQITTRLRGQMRAEQVQRVASACFTSNKTAEMGGFIRTADNGMLRRLAVIEVDAIDDYRDELDVDQLWAEAVLMLNNEDYAWTQEDFRQFTRENLKYIEVTNAMRLVKLYYRKPKANEEPKFMMASDVVFQLKQEKKITSSLQRIDDTSIGMALKALGFERYGKRTEKGVRYGYDVIPMFRK